MPRTTDTSKTISPRLLIRSSSIHAAGCYTLDPIPRGRRVLEYDGARIPKELADERYADRPVTYLFGFGGSTDVIDGFGTAMFLNHSCAPNCETEEERGRVYIRAIRDIAANEELVYEYNLYDSDEDSADCYCGAPQCRKTMFSDDELKRQARKAARKKSRLTAATK
jgi:SET domain-containing protein